MASKRHQRRQRCGKVKYAEPHAASLAVLAARRRTGHRNINQYRCPNCGGWHIGHYRRDAVGAAYQAQRRTP